MTSIDYIYYYKNRYGENVPIVTGNANDLSMVIFLSKEELSALMDKSNGKKIYVWLNGKSFIISSI
ncbi:MAG: hypothetical protein J6572_10620 [Gilliamella sp.]|nr:hypothetical protein [Lactobacillus sp.]MCO6555449.1 hypothetical protein [Gilliamella sp.]